MTTSWEHPSAYANRPIYTEKSPTLERLKLKTLIYALRDPLDGGIRYVGKTRYPYERMIEHLKAEESSPKDVWIRELEVIGLVPWMIVLAAVSSGATEAERKWILRLREEGHDLLNAKLPGGAETKTPKPTRWRPRVVYDVK